MASYRYTKDISPDNTQQSEKKVLTKKEKFLNFCYYHKVALIAVPLVIIFAVWAIIDLFVTPKPDYSIVVLTETPVAADFLDELQTKVASYGQDLNKDGKILVMASNYITPTEQNDTASSSGMLQLQADLEMGSTVLFLCDNVAHIQKEYNIFTYIDTPYTSPTAQATDYNNMQLSWQDACADKINFSTYNIYGEMQDGNDIANNLSFAIRFYTGSALDGDEDFSKYYTANLQLFEALCS